MHLFAGFVIEGAKKCDKILGMQNDQIPDSAISASTSYNSNGLPKNGRLHFQAKSGAYGSWVANKGDQFQWFLVDFGSFTKITGLSTQGRQDVNWWVKTYSLSFSFNGVFFEGYKENSTKKVNNFDDNLVHSRWLSLNWHQTGVHANVWFFLSLQTSWNSGEIQRLFNVFTDR